MKKIVLVLALLGIYGCPREPSAQLIACVESAWADAGEGVTHQRVYIMCSEKHK